ncbi:protein CASC5 [Crotalus adamanteus]|uniref:Protein CASC5 n=1 Tax=Crotalus adamanteus TaxID=8729 RepID=A0AAW1C5Q7_CROAD
MNEEKDFTDGTNKRRISSILKAPRTPLCDLGAGNELTQECNVEKRQKNSRRVSFAETIRVFPHDPQTFVELNHEEPSKEARNQNLLNENEEPEATKYEITGMNTLLHAPIHTLQQMECLDANPIQELNIMDRTQIFSEQNEMDMTSGHTVLITHDTKACQESDKPKKINFESFLNQENEDIQKEKKIKKDMDWNDIAEQKKTLHSTVVPHNNAETDENKYISEVMDTKLEKRQSSKNNLFDSFKADTDCNVQKNSELETQLLMDSICEQNLQEKLLEGTITVREFFTLLQVHVLIQMPRQSQLPLKHTVNTSSIPEDEILSHFIYHPKLQVYKEDCQTLHKIIEELKLHAADQDKLLMNMNKSFWEVMKTCSNEELRGFGAELNKMKSCFTKKSKALAHKGKAKLYVNLVHHAKLQYEKLQSRLAKMDELLKEMDSCLFALEKETATLDDSELDANYAMEEHETKLKHIESELENYKSQEDNLQRDQSDLRDQKQQIISGINQLQRDIRSCQERTEKYNFSEWVIKEWNDQQAVFTFLYDSVEFTVGFKCPSDDATFKNKFYREIVSLNFESLLDETKAVPAAKLVHKLIFQFIDSQNSWQEKCSTVYQLSQILRDLSLMVNRCQLLGEEIEFLNKWGGKFYLLKTEVNDTNISLLFSSSMPLAKFEVELSLSANYPTSPLAFTIQKCTGNLGPRSAETSVRLCVGLRGARWRLDLGLHGRIELGSLSTRKAAVGCLRSSGIDRLPLSLSRCRKKRLGDPKEY